MLKSVYEKLNSLKKDQLAAQYEAILKATDLVEEDEEEVEEAVEIPKTKAGMMKAIYDSLNGMKKAELSDSFVALAEE